MLDLPDIPHGSILGLNYSGMHDSAIAIVAPDGTPIFAAALERFSRVKQDGRQPWALLDKLPWESISKVAVSTEQAFFWPDSEESKLLRVKLPKVRRDGLRHEQTFYSFLEQLPCDKEFVCHQMAHAASAFWGSGFQKALCLTYDGGMCNSPWFGGLYAAERQDGIRPLDRFSALHYAKVTSLYTFVTALLGFTPNKHEGKITGLAAYGQPTNACRALLRKWFEEEFTEIESVMEWVFAYDSIHPSQLLTNDARIGYFRHMANIFSKEELAATVQEFAEQHVIEILTKARSLGWDSDNICLAGGLFANVKINQRIVESGFKKIFVAPPMTDDGTALGAAWHLLSKSRNFDPPPLHSVYLGPAAKHPATKQLLVEEGIDFDIPENAAETLAEVLSNGAVVAIFQNRMEFGPRALGNRSILAQANESDINRSLNARLNRTEFMPFAPVSRIEDARQCYLNVEQIEHAAEFMTVTVNCTEAMKIACPAVVHVDGTARPQLVSAQSNPLIHDVLTHYIKKTQRFALVNTSFNIHEEPIVCSPLDALHGFLESGLDYLYLDNGYLISFDKNKNVALKYLQRKVREPSQKIMALAAIGQLQAERLVKLESQLTDKERVIQQLKNSAAKLDESQQIIAQQTRTIDAYRMAYGNFPPLRLVARAWRRTREIVWPRLGNLNQYLPRPLVNHGRQDSLALSQYPSISITTPSFNQGAFIERTLLSICNQRYPKLEYFIQDGGSTDCTAEVLRKYQTQISGWISATDSGQSQAINRGFAKTTGEIMAWVNSDDLLLPGALHVVADFFNRNPEVDVVYGNRLLIDENDMEIGRWIMPGHDSAVLSWVDYVPQETLFWRRRIWDKAGGGVDESFRFAMDWDLLVRFRDAGARFAHIPQFLGAFRIHQHQKTSAAINEIGHREMDRIRSRLHGRIPSQKEIRKAALSYLIKHVAFDMAYRVKTRVGIKP